MDKEITTRQKSKNWKHIALWGGGVLVVIIIGLMVGGFILQNRLPEKIKSTVQEETDGVYRLDFADMSVSLLRGLVRLDGVSLSPDTTAYLKVDSIDRAAGLYDIKLNSITVSGIQIVRLLFQDNIKLSAITINQPDIVLMNMHDTVEADKVQKALYDKLPEFLKDTEVSLLRVNDLSFVEQGGADTSLRSGKLSGLTFALENLLLDSLRSADTTAFWFSDDVKVDSKNLRYASGDGMYVFNIASLKSSLQGGFLEISDFKITPQFPEIEFSQRLGTEGDRYHIVVEKIKASQIDFKELELHKVLKLASLSLENAELRIFNNKTLPLSGKIKAENFPNIAMKRLGLPTTVDTLFMKNFAVYYKELSPKSNKAGTVFFTHLNGTLKNVTNDSVQWDSDPWCKSSFTANFLGEVPLTVDLNLNMADPDGEFNYQGSLERTNGKLFNQLAEPLALARIEDGVINKVSFSISANRYGSSGTVQALYDNLEVSLLNADGSVLKKKGLLSFLANSFIIKNSNPRKEGDPPLTAEVSHVHPQDKSFFNLMWKSIFTGLKINFGVPDL